MDYLEWLRWPAGFVCPTEPGDCISAGPASTHSCLHTDSGYVESPDVRYVKFVPLMGYEVSIQDSSFIRPKLPERRGVTAARRKKTSCQRRHGREAMGVRRGKRAGAG